MHAGDIKAGSNPPVNSEARQLVGVAEARNLVTRRD
jgi:hypothetical protein